MLPTIETAPPSNRRRALLVEDDRDMRRLVSGMLRNEGLDVIEADGGVELLDRLRTAHA